MKPGEHQWVQEVSNSGEHGEQEKARIYAGLGDLLVLCWTV